MERWLSEQRPEIYRRLTAADVPTELQETILTSLAGDDYRRLPVGGARPNAVETDVLVVTPQFSPDMLKDIIALRSQRPGLHCTLLFEAESELETVSISFEKEYCREWIGHFLASGFLCVFEKVER